MKGDREARATGKPLDWLRGKSFVNAVTDGNRVPMRHPTLNFGLSDPQHSPRVRRTRLLSLGILLIAIACLLVWLVYL